jgi:cytochrome c oxidase subunit 3
MQQSTTVTQDPTSGGSKAAAGPWAGGSKPFGASFGKIMMWFFIVSDAFTFSGLLVGYGMIRFTHSYWPDPDMVFSAAPFIGHGYPLVFVGIMTFILIISSLTMVMAVEYGHRLKKGMTAFYLFLTIIGGITFLSCQAWEWNHLLQGAQHGPLVEQMNQGSDENGGHTSNLAPSSATAPVQLAADEGSNTPSEGSSPGHGQHGSAHGKAGQHGEGQGEGHHHAVYIPPMTVDYNYFGPKLDEPKKVERNGETYITNRAEGPQNFGQFFYVITGFHGAHVTSGVLINIIIFILVLAGVFQRKKNYEMVEKVGLYWHFVDLVWVFVFTFFYLV